MADPPGAQLAQLLKAVERAERTGTTAQLANALDQLAAYHHHAGAYREAAPVYGRALGMWRQILGPEHPVVGTQLINLGSILLHLGDLEGAEPLFRQALTIFEHDVTFDDPGVAQALHRFVLALRSAGRREEAQRIEARVRRVASLVQETVRA